MRCERCGIRVNEAEVIFQHYAHEKFAGIARHIGCNGRIIRESIDYVSKFKVGK